MTHRPAGVEAPAENSGEIRVDGGQVLMTAATAEGIDKVIKVGGKVNRSAYSDGGEIVLDGGERGTVAVTGTLDASSSAGHGGRIDIRGHKIALGKSLVKASGGAGAVVASASAGIGVEKVPAATPIRWCWHLGPRSLPTPPMPAMAAASSSTGRRLP